jgi:hypothetical protein
MAAMSPGRYLQQRRVLAADAVLADLRLQAQLETDDDAPHPPEVDPMASAQSRRAAREVG